MGRVLAIFPGDGVQSQVESYHRSSNIKDSEVVLDAVLLNTQHYKVRVKGKVEQSGERNSAFPNISM